MAANEILPAVDGPTEGHILISPSNSDDLTGKLLMLDKNGKVLFERVTATDAHNFQKWEVNGKVRYTYLEHKADAYQIMPHAIIPSVGVVLDESFNEINRITLIPYNAGWTGGCDSCYKLTN